MAISADLEKVFEIGPVFRAEKSLTRYVQLIYIQLSASSGSVCTIVLKVEYSVCIYYIMMVIMQPIHNICLLLLLLLLLSFTRTVTVSSSAYSLTHYIDLIF